MIFLRSNSAILCNFQVLHHGMPYTFQTLAAAFQLRTLFSQQELGVENFAKVREKINKRIQDPISFKHQFERRITNVNNPFPHFKMELKDLVYLIDNKPEDWALLKNALNQWTSKWPTTQEDKYSYGTIVMRLFHYHNQPDEAIQFFECADNNGIFSQFTAHQILLDLLYENKKYEDVLRIYNQLGANKYTDVIAFAAHYRLNLLENFNSAYQLWNKVVENKGRPFQKSKLFVAALAVKHKKPQIALDLLEDKTFHVPIRHIKMLAWAEMENFDEVFKCLSTTIKKKKMGQHPATSQQVLLSIAKEIDERCTGLEKQKFLKILEELNSLNLVSDEGLDDLICTPYCAKPPPSQMYGKQSKMPSSNENQ